MSNTPERDPDEITLTAKPEKIDAESHVHEILNLSRALELAIGGCEIPPLDRDALDALAFTVTAKLETLRAKLAAESP